MNMLLNVLLQQSPPICNMDFSHVVIFSLLKCVEYFFDLCAVCPTEWFISDYNVVEILSFISPRILYCNLNFNP